MMDVKEGARMAESIVQTVADLLMSDRYRELTPEEADCIVATAIQLMLQRLPSVARVVRGMEPRRSA